MNIHTTSGQLHISLTELVQLSQHFVEAFPVMDRSQQLLALNLYRMLAQGNPVSTAQLVKENDYDFDDAQHILDNWPDVFFDDNHNVIGFLGITIQAMPHHMLVNDTMVYTWCAWDALFIPELLNTTVQVQSICPVTKQHIKLKVSPNNAKALSTQDVVVSFLKPDLQDLTNNVTTNFCHFVHFFSHHAAGEQWCTEHPDTFLLSLDEAFVIGKKMNALRFNLTLS